MIEYDKDAIVHSYITGFLRAKIRQDDPLLHSLEEYAEENSVPIAEPETARFLAVLSRACGAKRILEIGTAIGYSAILMAKAAGAEVVSVENDSRMAELARDNIRKAGLEERISVVEADAKTCLGEFSGPFDLIFLDGPKAHYIYMLADCVSLLRPGGLLVADNVLYKGMIADKAHVVRRKITIVKRLRKFIDALMEHPQLETAILPLGDGVTISVKIDN